MPYKRRLTRKGTNLAAVLCFVSGLTHLILESADATPDTAGVILGALPGLSLILFGFVLFWLSVYYRRK